jgi:hypothetical protein
MKPMLRPTFVLLGIALALVGFIAFFERGSLSTTEREGRKGRVLDSFVRDRVTRLELQRNGVKTVLVRVPANPDDPLDLGGWRVEQPYAARADQTVVDTLLGELEWLEARRSLGDASAKELANFGLTAPRYRVSYLAGRQAAGFIIGGVAADGGGAYLQLQGKPQVFVVGKDATETLDHEPVDFHDKELHQGASVYTLAKLSIRDATSETRVVRRDGFDWLEAPYTALVSRPALTSVVDSLDALRATRFVTTGTQPPSPEYGLDRPVLTLVLESLVFDKAAAARDNKDKNKRTTERLTLQFGGACAGHPTESYVRVNDASIYCVATDELAKLTKSPDALRETRLLPLEDLAIEGVKLHAGNRELTLTTKDGATSYRVTEQGRELQKGVADPGALSDWYSALRGVKAERFDALDAGVQAKLESHAAVTASFQRGKEAPYVIRLGDAEASRLNEPAKLSFPPDAKQLLTASVARFRKPRLLDEDEARFSKLVLTRAGSAPESVSKTKEAYTLDGPVTGAAQRSTVDEIVRIMSKLDAIRFVADTAAPEHGFAQPYRTLRVEYQAEPQPHVHTLVLGAKQGDAGRFARIDADPAVFVVSPVLGQKLEDPLISRSTVAVPVDELASFRVTAAGGKPIEVIRDASGFVIAGLGETSRARAAKLVGSVDALGGARPLAYTPAAVGGAAALRLSLKLRDGRELTWQVGISGDVDATESAVIATRSDLPVKWLVPGSVLEALRERPPAAAAVAKSAAAPAQP